MLSWLRERWQGIVVTVVITAIIVAIAIWYIPAKWELCQSIGVNDVAQCFLLLGS